MSEKMSIKVMKARDAAMLKKGGTDFLLAFVMLDDFIFFKVET
jgi:hypothetical protein